MQDLTTGQFLPLSIDEALTLRHIAAAGNREAPIFGVGDHVSIRGGNFRVLAVDGRLLVLEGIPSDEVTEGAADV